MSDDWFSTGFKGKHIDNARREIKSKGINRFWLKKGETSEILFLDEDPACIWEHRLKINNRWKGNEYTCRRGMDPGCPLCASGIQRTYAGFLTVLNLTGFKDDDGKWHRNLRRLFPMGLENIERFENYRNRKEGLTGWKVEVQRFENKSNYSIGDMFEFLDRVKPFEDEEFFYVSKMDGGKKKPPEPFDYREIFKPLPASELAMLSGDMNYNSESSTKDDSSKSGGDGDIPY